MELADLVDDIVHGSGLLPLSVTATAITRPGEAAIDEAAFVWHGNIIEDHPSGGTLRRNEPRRVGSFRRSEVTDVPRGTTFDAPEKPGGAATTWRVDGHADTQANYITVVVMPD
jgi:hypothetical protein